MYIVQIKHNLFITSRKLLKNGNPYIIEKAIRKKINILGFLRSSVSNRRPHRNCFVSFPLLLLFFFLTFSQKRSADLIGTVRSYSAQNL